MKCDIKDGGTGGCGMYTQADGEIRERFPDRYLAAVDTAIESMPMVHYHPRGKFLQVCTVGCNFKCNGCVSEVLTDHFSAIEGSFQEMTPEDVIQKAMAESCIGVMFCFNEPTVSYFTFLRLAKAAKENGLLVGCSTNGYMTRWALEGLIPVLDFVNVGLKGTSRDVYRSCGVGDVTPIFRNLQMLHEKGVYIEVSAIYRKNGEHELCSTADFVASLSRDIPFQVMRFIPFGDATIDMEPSFQEAEAICRRLRKQLRYVYLFNTPGTDYLNSCCPDCGEKIMERGFFGPMCSNLFKYRPEGRCSCGFELPVHGKIHDTKVRETGYFGGYRTINAMNMIQSILGVLGVTDGAHVDAVMIALLKADFIQELYERLNRIDSYFDTVDYFAKLSGRENRAKLFREYVSDRIREIETRVEDIEKPAVYCSLGHPLIAMFTEKMESRLIEVAGGALTNALIEREPRPGITISREQFCRMNPEIIIVSDAVAWPAGDVIDYCKDNVLYVPAMENRKIFDLHPFRCSTNPDWILGLMQLANLIHPETFNYDVYKEADDFYRTFLGIPFEDTGRRSVSLKQLRQKKTEAQMHPVT